MGEIDLRELIEVRLGHLESKIDMIAKQVSAIANAHDTHRDRYLDYCERNAVDHKEYEARFAELRGRNGAKMQTSQLDYTFWTKMAALFVGTGAVFAAVEMLLRR